MSNLSDICINSYFVKEADKLIVNNASLVDDKHVDCFCLKNYIIKNPIAAYSYPKNFLVISFNHLAVSWKRVLLKFVYFVH